MADSAQVSFAITARNAAGQVIAEVTRDFDNLTRTVGGSGAHFSALHGSLKEVGESTEGARRGFTALERGLHSLADEVIGLPGPFGMLAKALEEFAGGSAAVVGVSAGLAAVAGAYELIAKSAERARTEHEEFMKSMDPEGFFAKEAMRPGTFSAFQTRSLALQRARPGQLFGGGGAGIALPEFFTEGMTNFAAAPAPIGPVNVSNEVLRRAAGLGVGAQASLAAGAETRGQRETTDNLKFLGETAKGLANPGLSALNDMMKNLEGTAAMDRKALEDVQKILEESMSPAEKLTQRLTELKQAFDKGAISAEAYTAAKNKTEGDLAKAQSKDMSGLFAILSGLLGGTGGGGDFTGLLKGIMGSGTSGNPLAALSAIAPLLGSAFGSLFQPYDANVESRRLGALNFSTPTSTGGAPIKVRIEEWSPTAIMPNPTEPRVISISLVGAGSGAQLEQTKVVLARDAQRDAVVRIPRGVYLGP